MVAAEAPDTPSAAMPNTTHNQPPSALDRISPEAAEALEGQCEGLLSALSNAVTVVLTRSAFLCAEIEPAHPLARDAVDLQRASVEAAQLLRRLACLACSPGEA